MKMKTALALLLSLCLVLSAPVAVFAADFDDTDGHWAEGAIDKWTDYGVLNGKGGDLFDPNAPMKRGEAAVMFAKLLGLTETADISGFADVSAEDWYADALAKCVAAGIMNGVGDDQMNPEGTITREMFFTMFARALGIKPEASLNSEFADAGEVSDWAEGYVNALINNGYVNGVSDDEIAPEIDINRASVVTLLNQTVKQYVTEEGAVVDASEGGLILVVADDVKIENAPEGTVVVTAPETTGTTANDQPIEKDEYVEVVVPEEPVVTPGGGGSGNGGGVNDSNNTETQSPQSPQITSPKTPAA